MKDVFMYTLSTCPWCRKSKQYFTERNVPFKYVDYDLQSPQEQQKIEKEIRGSRRADFVSLGAHRRRAGCRVESGEIRRAVSAARDGVPMSVEPRKRSLRYFFAKVVEPLGYKFTPDGELADFLLEQEARLEEAHGSPFCPCQGRTQNHEHNMQIVCPCIPFHREHFDYMKRCWCGLFVHKDVTDPDSLPQIPYPEFRKATNADRGGEDR